VSPAAAAGWCRGGRDVPVRCLRTTSFDTLELEIAMNYYYSDYAKNYCNRTLIDKVIV